MLTKLLQGDTMKKIQWVCVGYHLLFSKQSVIVVMDRNLRTLG